MKKNDSRRWRPPPPKPRPVLRNVTADPRSAAQSRIAQQLLGTLVCLSAVPLAWPLYGRLARRFSELRDAGVIAPGSQDLWWSVGGWVTGGITASALLIALAISATRLRALKLSLFANVAVLIVSMFVAGLLFTELHDRQQQRERQIAQDQTYQEDMSRERKQEREAESTRTQELRSEAAQAMARLEPGSIASTIAAAEKMNPRLVLTGLRDNLAPFLDQNPWSNLSYDDRAALSAFARRALKISGSKDHADALTVLGMVLGAEHGLADVRGAIDECRSLKVDCRDGVAELAAYLCRDGSACLKGYENLDLARLAKDFAGGANRTCGEPPMIDTELCQYVRGNKQ